MRGDDARLKLASGRAVVELRDASQASEALKAELIAYCRARMSAIKCPRSIDFERDLPRMPTGKLLKRLLCDLYWPAARR